MTNHRGDKERGFYFMCNRELLGGLKEESGIIDLRFLKITLVVL